jgi:dipeptidyl aminopeptidase/acylaminoacyl peptidase
MNTNSSIGFCFKKFIPTTLLSYQKGIAMRYSFCSFSLCRSVLSVLVMLVLFCNAAAVTTIIAEPEKPKVLPAETFYRLPLFTNITLSPDGTHIVALKNMGDTTAVMTVDLATGKTFYPAITDNKKFKFSWVDWGNNDRLLISILFAQGEFGASVKFTYTRLVAMDAKKPSKMLNLVKQNAVRPNQLTQQHVSQFQDRVLGRVPGEPNHIFMGVDRDVLGHQAVYNVDVTNAETTTVKGDGSPRSWVLDRQGIPRVSESYDDRDKKMSYEILDPKTDKWISAWEYIIFDQPSITPLGFGKNASELYLFADYQGRQALYKADLSKEGYPRELILSDPNYDIRGRLIESPSLNDVVGLYYSDTESKSIFFNKEFKSFQGGIDKVLPDSKNHITSLSDDGRKYVVNSRKASQPSVVYIGDRDTKALDQLDSMYPELTADVLVKKEFMKYKARDGLELEGYLSRPKNFSDKPVPTLIFPHGGPMSEDGAEFDEFSAFFVNRGYAVFQPNFRGSTGRGFEFEMKAVGAMGLAMQDDLEDAVKFLVEQKIADPKRVGIVGGSYGGYAALMGATKTPDLFQCAISLAGVSDIKKLRDTSRYFINKNSRKELLGNDIDQLKKTSPARMVDKVKIPILLIHGKDDTVVPVDQSRIMAQELKAQKKVYEYIELEGGSHHFDYFPHRKQTFEAMEAFLKKYLPVE